MIGNQEISGIDIIKFFHNKKWIAPLPSLCGVIHTLSHTDQS